MGAADLAAALGDPDVEVRLSAVKQLSNEPAATVVESLIRGLGDTDWRVREEAVRAGGRMAEGSDVLAALVKAVSQGENVGLRNAALELLRSFGQRAVPALVEALPGADSSARRFLVEALASGGDAGAQVELIAALASPDPNLVVAAMDALAGVGGDAARAPLLAVLLRGDSYLSHCALQAFERMQVEVPFEALAGLLSDKVVRRAALEALGRSRDPRALGVLVDAVQDAAPRVVATAVRALTEWFDLHEEAGALVGALGGLGPEALTRLREQAETGDPTAAALLLLARDQAGLDTGLRECAERGNVNERWLRALNAWGEPGIAALLERARRGPHRIQAVALELACHRAQELSAGVQDEVRATLRGALAAVDDDVRQVALDGLGRWGAASDAALLAERCRDQTPEVAAAAAAALLTLAQRHPVAVRDALGHLAPDAFDQPTWTRLLVLLDGDTALSRLQQASTHHDVNVRAAAVEALALLGTPSAAEVIALSLADESEQVQEAAARALGDLAQSARHVLGVEPLLLALEHAAPGVQAAAARALGQFADPRVPAALCERARHGEPIVQLAAIEALRGLESPEVGELMVEALGHADVEVVKQALQGIAERPHPRMASRLALALGHPSWAVRKLAARLLGELDAASAVAPLEARLGQEADPGVRTAIEDALTRLEGGR